MLLRLSAFPRRLLQFAGLRSMIGERTDLVIPLSEISAEIFFISNCLLLAQPILDRAHA